MTDDPYRLWLLLGWLTTPLPFALLLAFWRPHRANRAFSRDLDERLIRWSEPDTTEGLPEGVPDALRAFVVDVIEIAAAEASARAEPELVGTPLGLGSPERSEMNLAGLVPKLDYCSPLEWLHGVGVRLGAILRPVWKLGGGANAEEEVDRLTQAVFLAEAARLLYAIANSVAEGRQAGMDEAIRQAFGRLELSPERWDVRVVEVGDNYNHWLHQPTSSREGVAEVAIVSKVWGVYIDVQLDGGDSRTFRAPVELHGE